MILDDPWDPWDGHEVTAEILRDHYDWFLETFGDRLKVQHDAHVVTYQATMAARYVADVILYGRPR